MESYIPLVKAIIITTVSWYGSSLTWITEDFIIYEQIYYDHLSETVDTFYGGYNLKTDYIYHIDERLNVRDSTHLETIRMNDDLGFARNNFVQKTTTKREVWGGYQCKVVNDEIYIPGMIPPSRWEEQSYFAKIPWLDKILDNEVKMNIAGFTKPAKFKSYNFLIYRYSENLAVKSLTTIEMGSIDSTIFSKIFALPPGRDYLREPPKN